MHTPWQELGMAPTRDEASIRSAFRTRMLALKRSGLHEDLRHVQPLREAYTAALRAAAGTVAGEAEDVAPQAPAQAAHTDNPPVAHGVQDRGGRQPVDESAGQQEGAPAEPVGAPAPQQAQPEEDLGALAAAAARACIRSDTPPASLPSRWRELVEQPRWQRPEAARALQQALAQCLLEFMPTLRAQQSTATTEMAAMRLAERWLDLALFAADLHRWWPPRPPGHAAHLGAVAALWDLVCGVSTDHLLQLVRRDEVPAACRLLDRWLQHPALQALDSRAAWLAALASSLRARPRVPPVFLDTLLQHFGLQDLQPGEHADPAIDMLVALHRSQYNQRLLQRVAQRQEVHPLISPGMAAALLQPTISQADRHAVRTGQLVEGKPWLAQMRRAIAFLRDNAPDALEPTEPPVLRWWCGPHVTPHDWWDEAMMVVAVLGGLVALALFGSGIGVPVLGASALGALAGMLLFLLTGMAAGAWLGLRAGMGLTWLHMHWYSWVYPAWRRQDAAWARRIPLVGSLLPTLNIWLSRDLLVLWGLLQTSDGHTWVPYAAFAGWRLVLWLAARGSF